VGANAVSEKLPVEAHQVDRGQVGLALDPGIGQSLIYAIFARDVPVIQFEVILLAAFYVGLNILADLITILVTPKLRARAWQTS